MYDRMETVISILASEADNGIEGEIFDIEHSIKINW